MNLNLLLSKLKELKVKLSLQEGKLNVNAPEGVLTKKLIAEIKERKQEILGFLGGIEEDKYQAIVPTAEKDRYSLSHAQTRIWIVSQLDETASAFNMPLNIWLKGNLKRDLLERAFTTLVERHESLRTVFEEENGLPYQRILSSEEQAFKCDFKDLRGLENVAVEAEEIAIEYGNKPFDLINGPLVRIKIYQTGAEENLLCLCMHHIVSDEWSMKVLFQEIIALYNAFCEGNDNPLLPLDIQYKDFTDWQIKALESGQLKGNRKYWLEKLSGTLPVLNLPSDFPRPPVQTYEGASLQFDFSSSDFKRFKSLIKEAGASPFMGVVTLVNILLHRYCNQSDIIIGTPSSGRDHNDLENQIGLYINMLALRCNVDSQATFVELLNHVKQVVLEAHNNESYPFDLLIDELDYQRDAARSPLFDVMVLMEKGDGGEVTQLPELSIVQSDLEIKTTKYDLTFFFQETNDGLSLRLEYNTSIYSETSIQRFGKHLSELFTSVLEASNTKCANLNYLPETEITKIKNEFNDSTIDYPSGQTIIDLLETQVAKTPDAIALYLQDTQFTYAELNEKANRLAHFIRSKYEIKAGQLIGLHMDRDEWLIIGMLGILKSGAAYLPIDKIYPPARIKYLLEDGGATLLVTNETLAIDTDLSQINLNEEWSEIQNELNSNPVKINSAEDLAYTIYTSGSTGTPKGVMIQNDSVVNMLRSVGAEINIQPTDKMLAITTHAFDMSVVEIFVPLVNGAAVFMVDAMSIRSPLTLRNIIEKEMPTVMQATPGMWQMLIDSGWKGSKDIRLITGGEALSFALGEKLLESSGSLWNMYGPTETTVYATTSKISEPKDINSIGTPVKNMSAYILDDNHQMVGIGVTGNLFVGGAGLAKGYKNKESLTKEKFVSNPFNTNDRLYDTGDLCSWTPEGKIKYYGRKDTQVKIRGYRIELEEIEMAMLNFEPVSNVVVVSYTKKSDKYLAAYFTSSVETNVVDLRTHLRNLLPDYMMPATFIALDKLPLTPNGKVDKKALPEPNMSSTETYVSPQNEWEIQLAKIWSDVLDVKQVGLNDNFFELGGHSIKAVQIVAQVYQQFAVKLDLKNIFIHATLLAQAELIRKTQQNKFIPIPVSEIQEDYPLSPSQKRLWLQEEQKDNSLTYNIFNTFLLKGELNQNALDQAFDTLIDRHEILRTIFVLSKGEPRQKVLSKDENAFGIEFNDLTVFENPEEEAKTQIKTFGRSSFSLSKGSLLRIKLLKLDTKEHLLLFANHHIISDEWSMQVLVRDVIELYNAYCQGDTNPLPELSIQYKDFASWELEKINSGSNKEDRQYWLNQFTEELPTLELPSDRPRPPVQSNQGEQLRFELSKELSSGLRKIVSNGESTLFMGLMSLINTLLYRYTGQSDITIGTPVAGREHPDLKEQIGYYLNTLALRNKFDGTDRFVDLLEKVKQQSLDGFAHQDYPFDYLINDLDIRNDLSRSPLFDVVIILQNIELNILQNVSMNGLVVEERNEDLMISKGDLRFEFLDYGSHLEGNIEYNTDLYDRERIVRMVSHLENLLTSIIQSPESDLRSLNYLSANEKELSTWFEKPIKSEIQKPVCQLFEEQALRTPNQIAIENKEHAITYELANQVSNRFARLLQDVKVEAGDSVGMMMPSSTEAIFALLSIFKTGGVYVPISTKFPEQRIAEMIADANITHLIIGEKDFDQFYDFFQNTDNALQSIIVFSMLDVEEVAIDIRVYFKDGNQLIGEKYSVLNYSNENLESNFLEGSSSYIYYTSGSTGKPKGIIGTHNSLSHYVQWHAKNWNVDNDFRVSQLAPLTFDASLKDIWVALISGATLCIPSTNDRENMSMLTAWLADSNITLLQTVPSLFRVITKSLKDLNQTLPSLKYIALAGEKLYGQDLLEWKEVNGNTTEISNLYGLTETTILKAKYTIPHLDWEPSEVIPVGTAIDDAMIAVVNEGGLCMWGEIGEIYIKTPYCTNGYLTDELNEKLFVQNPLVTTHTELVCRTGDIGRYNAKGVLEILGRNDRQVKISGVRIELESVQKSLLGLNEIVQVELVVHENQNYQKELVCYYTGKERTGEILRKELATELSPHALPSYYIWLEEFPLNLNGKVDKKALPKPFDIVSNQDFEAPTSQLEQKVADIWADVLEINQPIGRQHSFFNIGGSSLKAIQLISRLYKELEIQLTIGDVFNNPVLADQAALIKSSQQQKYEPISKAAEAETYPLSPTQKRAWILAKIETEHVPFNGIQVYEFSGKLKQEALVDAFDTLVERHESLRTVFELKEGEPRQRILSKAELGFELEFEDFTTNEINQEELTDYIKTFVKTPFDLEKGPLFRAKLLKTSEDTHLFLLSDHHIISDEWSMQVLIRDILTLYNAYGQGKENPLSTLPIQFKDYVTWQSDELKSETYKSVENYWMRQLSGEFPRLELPSDRPRPTAQSYHGGEVKFELPPLLSQGLQEFVSDNKGTLFMGLMALVKTLLYRYTGQSDIVIGTPVAGRDHPDLEDQFGCYINTLALRTQFEGNEDFHILFDKVKQQSLEGFSHQSYPFDHLVEKLDLLGTQDNSALFNVVLILQNVKLNKLNSLQMEGIEVTQKEVDLNISRGDLRFQFIETETGIEGSIEYNTDLYDKVRIDRMVIHMENLLHAILENPEAGLRSYTYLASNEEELTTWFAKDIKNITQPKIHQLFEANIDQYKEKTAIEYGNSSISYEGLNKGSNKLGHLLKSIGVDLGDKVGVMVPSGIEAISCILGLFKTGSIYVPLSSKNPEDLILQMLQDASITCLIINKDNEAQIRELLATNELDITHIVVLPESGGNVLGDIDLNNNLLIELDEGRGTILTKAGKLYEEKEFTFSTYPESNLNIDFDASASSYIFYTSGSTGRPKGIIGSHNSISQYVQWHVKEWDVNEKFRISQLAPMTFDASLKDILVALVAGGTLCIPNSKIRNNMFLLTEWLANSKINMLQTVPSLFRLITKSLLDKSSQLLSLKHILLSGEKLYGRDLEQWELVNGKITDITNLYGLTETTVLKTCYRIPHWNWEPADVIPVGFAIDESMIAVINEGGLCMWGEIGEVYIKSPYVTKGYLNTKLNERLFVQNPIVEGVTDIVCRTGDFGRYNTAGELEIFGRKDQQVKINGVRIDLEGIKENLLRLTNVTQVELVVHEDEAHQKSLICYYSGTERSADDLRKELAETTNPYALPGYFLWMEEFPLSINGKVDRHALPKPEEFSNKNYEAPSSELERSLAAIWKNILRVNQPIGRNDSFFNLGGTSLKAIQLISILYKEHEVQITLEEIFKTPVLSDLAISIGGADQISYQAIQKIEEQDSYDLSHAQRRLWVMEEHRDETAPYNGIEVYRLNGALNRAALDLAFETLIERHESLRTIFVQKEGQARQRILTAEECLFNVQFEDLKETNNPANYVDDFIKTFVQKPFDLRNGPLLRVALLQLAEEEHVFLLSDHHIISDDWSMKVLVRDAILLYNAYNKGEENPLTPLPIQFKDYVAWQLAQLNEDQFAEDHKYWMNQFAGELPSLDLSSDRPRPAQQSFNGNEINFSFSEKVSSKLKNLVVNKESTLFMGLLGMIKILLYRYTGQQDITIGTPVAGREHLDLENQFGYFINTLALRTKFDKQDDFFSLLENVKAQALSGFTHQNYPFDYLVEKLGLGKDLSRSPLFDVVVILQNVKLDDANSLEMDGLQVEQEDVNLNISKSDLRFQFAEIENRIEGRIEYNTDMYDQERIERMIQHMQNLLSSIVENPELPLSSFNYRSDEEEESTNWFSEKIEKKNQLLLHHLIEEKAITYPDKNAVEFSDDSISYRELNQNSNQLSRLLQELNVTAENSVGVMLPAGIEVVSSMLSLFKLGSTYIPLSIDSPLQHIQQILLETKTTCFITNKDIYNKLAEFLKQETLSIQSIIVLPESGENILGTIDLADDSLITLNSSTGFVDVENDNGFEKRNIEFNNYSNTNLSINYSPDTTSYIFYTSGSTGKPKGIVGSYSSISHYIQWHKKEWLVNEDSRISQLAPITFDASLKDILVALIAGATLCVPAKKTKDNMLLLGQWLAKKEVTILQTVPSLFRLITKSLLEQSMQLPALNNVLLSGERLFGKDLQQWQLVNGTRTEISNLYGLTETTVLKTYYRISNWNWEASAVIPVGQPIDDTMVAVISDSGLCMWGEIGEVYIKTPYTTKGYLDASLNERLFVQNPLVENDTDIVCRTGDIGRYNQEGILEILGRQDKQIKINGVRIEMEDVRSKILALKSITQVELSVHEDDDHQKELVCYYTGENLTGEIIRTELLSVLNASAIPGYFVWLEEFPLNLNGKVDKKSLPKPTELIDTSKYETPVGKTERALAVIWQKTLGIKHRVGRQDSFFNLGGTSLKAMRLITMLYKEFDIELTIGEIFKQPILLDQADLIKTTQRTEYQPIKKAPLQQTFELSPAQRRIWLVEQHEREALPFNGLEIYSLEGALNKEALNQAFDALIERHESLRTVFELKEGIPRQCVLNKSDLGFAIDYKDISNLNDQDESVKKITNDFAKVPFDLEQGPLLKVCLVELNSNKFVLLISEHHIISDDWSMQVLIRDVLSLYNAFCEGKPNPLPELSIQYKDYTRWQMDMMKEENMDSDYKYWMSQFFDEIPSLELQKDNLRPEIQSHNGDQVRFKFSEKQSQGLKEIVKENNVTLFMGVLALVNTLMYRYTGQSDVVIGTPVAGRNHPDLEDQIGCYLNTLAFRTQFDGDDDFNVLLEKVKKVTLDGFTHQAYPFDNLVEQLGLGDNSGRSPLFDVVVVLQNVEKNNVAELIAKGIEVERHREELKISKGDLRFQFMEGEGIEGAIEFNSDIYRRARVENMILHLKNVLDSIIDDSSTTLRKLQYRSADQKKRTLQKASLFSQELE